MASLCNDGGLRRILFLSPDGKRKALRLGRIPIKRARTILGHVEALLACRQGYAPPAATLAWLDDDIGDKLRERLAILGLVAPKASPKSLTIGELVEQFKSRPNWQEKKPTTRQNYEMHFKYILAGLGANTMVCDVTEAAADDLPAYLAAPKPKGGGLCRASVGRFTGSASMLFRYAVRARIIDRNPFDEVRRGSCATTRRAFVDDATSRKVLNALSGTQWRLLFALARWGGLRVPSEPRLLRWGDIDWENDRFTVTSPKTAHHEGHASRVVPIFPELAALLADRYAEAEPGEELVLPMMQGKDNATFRQHMKRTLLRLGADLWPRVFHSLRSTRQTELEQLYPTYVVCEWLGNSAAIAARHYLQVTDEHFTKAAQNPAQQVSEPAGNGTKNRTGSPSIPAIAR